jgi:hypothetical protein
MGLYWLIVQGSRHGQAGSVDTLTHTEGDKGMNSMYDYQGYEALLVWLMSIGINDWLEIVSLIGGEVEVAESCFRLKISGCNSRSHNRYTC